jgi:hypothetical protein
LAALQKAYADAQKKSNTDKIDSAGLSKQKIKAIQDEIKAIRERAEARKKALRETFDKENAELELQKAKLDLQNAVARGDNEAAAAAQIRIQQIQKEVSLKAAESKIDENAKKAEAKQQAILDKDAAYKDALKEGAAKQGKKADNLQGSISTISSLAATLGRVAQLQVFAEAPTATAQQKTDFKQAFANALNDIAKAAKSDPKVLESYGQFLERTDTGKKDKQGNPVYDYKKDAKGNFVPGKMNEAQLYGLPGGVKLGYGQEGSALTELKQLSKGMSDFAIKMMGNGPYNTLSDIYNILAKATPKGVKEITKDYGNINFNKFNPATWANTDNLAKLIKQEGLKKDDTFTYKGKTYTVKGTSGIPTVEEKKMAMGGYVRKYESGSIGGIVRGPGTSQSDSIPAFLSNGEYVLNAAAVSKFGVPMLDKMNTAYNIPTGTTFNGTPSMNNSYNNNVYNIDIDLNGTNVTADDIMRKFKSELALIGAKEGRVRTLGGNY